MRWALLALPVLAVLLLFEYRLLNTASPPPLPPVMSAGQIEALPDAALISAVTTDLRIRLTAGGTTSGRWRTWPAAARQVLAWSWVEADNGPGAPARFAGFLGLLGNRDSQLPVYEDIAEAYAAIGRAEVAVVLREAESVAAGLAGTPEGDPFAALDQRFRTALGRTGSVAAMRTHIRSHIADLAEAR